MTSSPSNLMIEARGVEKWYPNGYHALRGVDLTVHRGEVVVVMGPSGSGKSTFIRTFNALEDFQKGTIRIDGNSLGNDLRQIDAIRREVGMVFQQFNLFPHGPVPRSRPRPSTCWIGSASRSRPRNSPVSFREASNSASPSPGPCAWSPGVCCLMNPPVPWIPRWSGRCWM